VAHCAAGAALAATVAIAGAAPPVPQATAQNPAPRPTGLIVGRVIDGATNKPLPSVMVTVGGADIRPRRVMCDARGRFLFHELPAGAFTIGATRTGYIASAHGVLRPDGAGRSLELRDGQRVTDVTIRMWRFATISGVVTDDAGDPVPYARVQALKRTVVAGRWRLVNSSQGGDVDERGAYRITGLVPGDYALVITSHASALPASLLQLADAVRRMPGPESSALLTELQTNGTSGYVNDLMQRFPVTRSGDLLLQTGGNVIVSPDGRSIEAYPTVWYPAAATPADASLVSVGAGENRAGIDLHPTLTKTRRISGTVMGPDGPVPHLALRLVPARIEDASAEITSSISLSLTTATAATDANGGFTFVAVPPGDYIVRAITTPRPIPLAPVAGAAQPPLVPTDPILWTATPVSVGDTDATGVTVTLRAGLRITGRVEFTGTATRPDATQLRGIRVAMDPADGRSIARPSSYQAQIDSNGRFYTIGLIAGSYLVRVTSAPRGWTLKSAMLRGRDICDVPVTLESNDLDGLVLTFTDRPSTLNGTVRPAQDKSDDDATVLMFPSDGVWTDVGSDPRRLRSVRASGSGAFSVSGLPAGEYYVIAVSDALVSNWQDPAFLQKLARVATRVSLADGQAASVNLATSGGIVR
jgi:hypothetical protein